jgi:hypothetical protein
MKIYIKTTEGRVLRFPLPMSLVKLGLSCGHYGIRAARKHVDKETLQYLEAIDFRLLGNSINELRYYKGLRIVDIKSSTGEEVSIII